jgi:acyl-CoA dehydrogenase
MRRPSLQQYHENLPAIIERLHVIGRETIGPRADAVDREAMFPTDSMNALKGEKLLSCYVPVEFGGMGLSITDVSKICEVLGTYCGSTAMVFAMHQIQIACIVHHAMSSEFFKSYMREIAEKQLLLASATTELGVGGDVRTSLCAAVISGNTLTLEKQAPVISYGEHADGILVTCRKSPEASGKDQVHVLVTKKDYTLKRLSDWDTMGFRGTCSCGFVLTAKCNPEQVIPVPYAEIHSKTMHPYSHSVWASLWLGIAGEAVSRARTFTRAEARKNPGTPPPSALRLAELDTVLFSMRGGIQQQIAEYQHLLDEKDDEAFSSFGFVTRTSNLKLTSSMLIVEIVGKAMLICGISGYRNDSKLTLARLLRDAYGAALMVNNDRILGQSSTLQLVQRD